MKNKTSLILLAAFVSLSGCGDGLVDHSKDGALTESLTSGASMILDAKTLAGGTPGATGVCDKTSLTDSSGNHRDGTIACSTGGGRSGTGTVADPYRIVFNGTSTLISTSLDANAATLPSSTWMAWIRPQTQSTLAHLLSQANTGTDYSRALVLDSAFKSYIGTGVHSYGVTPDTSDWQFVAMTFSSSDVVFFKNGSKVGGSAPTYGASSTTFTVGSSVDGSDFYSGDVAWVAVYPSVLSDAQISANCRALAHRFQGADCN